ncbi:hypothetical protein B7463_g4837, partial [Scytalidium lignicola]
MTPIRDFHLTTFLLLTLIFSSLPHHDIALVTAVTAASTGVQIDTIATNNNNNNKCTTFLTIGPTSTYFTHHRFYDFRNIIIDDSSTIPAGVPEMTSNPNITANEDATSANSDADTDTGHLTTMVTSANNVYIETETEAAAHGSAGSGKDRNTNTDRNGNKNTTHLTLRTTRLQTFQTAAEIDSTMKKYLFLSVRFAARIRGGWYTASGSDNTTSASGDDGRGACAGMFTYHPTNSTSSNNNDNGKSNGNNNDTTVEESDIEILASDPSNSVHFTNQPSRDSAGNAVLGATMNVTIPSSTTTKGKGKNITPFDRSRWNVYRMDWMRDRTAWYINGVSVANISVNVPRRPMGIVVNMWSDGGLWSGEMDVGQEVVLQIRWIEVAFNTSSNSGYEIASDYVGSEGALGRMNREGKGGEVICVIGEGDAGRTRSGGVRRGKGVVRVKLIMLVVIGTVMVGYF